MNLFFLFSTINFSPLQTLTEFIWAKASYAVLQTIIQARKEWIIKLCILLGTRDQKKNVRFIIYRTGKLVCNLQVAAWILCNMIIDFLWQNHMKLLFAATLVLYSA